MLAEAWRDKDERMPLGVLGVIALVSAAIALAFLWNRNTSSFNVILADNFGIFVSLVLAVVGILTIAFSSQVIERDGLPAGEYYALVLFVVFLGRVVRSQPLVYVELDVLETFNGRLDRRVRILTGRSDCDYFLPPVLTKSGARFLVYGTLLDDGRLAVNRCLGSGPSNLKTHELERLRQRARERVSGRFTHEDCGYRRQRAHRNKAREQPSSAWP
jgi:NADH-quinone oxidoreductase subunit N